MAKEPTYNIFIYFSGGTASSYGVHLHHQQGDDDTKLRLLQSKVFEDHVNARRFSLPRSFTPAEWLAAQRYGEVLVYFHEAFEALAAPENPLVCVTSIVDGEVKIDSTIGPEPFRGEALSAASGKAEVPDYLVEYMDGSSFRFTELIHDDYFKAIRALYKEKLYVSCSKLLMSCIDTLSFVEFGDVKGNFIKWLKAYVELGQHNISAEELWEFRNSLLHMTNLSSRKVIAGKVSPLMPYVGGPATLPPISRGGPKPFNLYGLIVSIGEGIGRWADTYNKNRDKNITFIERYDSTISDSRMLFVPWSD